MKELKEQFDKFLDHIDNADRESSILSMEKATASCSELLLWLDTFSCHFHSSTAKELLIGARSSMLETVAYISLSFGRAAITAIRTQIDLILAFTYFCDHPTEWDMVKKTGKGFQLRTDIDKYHETKLGFKKKLSLLEDNEGNSISNLYKILSAHIHGQSPLTIPKSGYFYELFSSQDFIESLIEMQRQVDKCLSNYLAVVSITSHISLPLAVELRIKRQLSIKQRQVVFFEN